MTDLYSKNASTFAKFHPLQVLKLNQTSDPFPVNIEGNPGQFYWNYKGQRGEISSRSNQGFNTIQPHKHLFVLYGIGDGEYIRRLVEFDQVRYVLVFEPSINFFNELMAKVDLTDVFSNSKISFVLGTDKTAFISEIETYLFTDIERYCFSGHFGNLVVPGIEKLPDLQIHCLNFANAFKSAVGNVGIRAQFSMDDSFYGFKNTFRNVPILNNVASIDSLSGKFEGYSAAIVASGPSLKFSIPCLKQNQSKLLIICCDSTFPILIKNGIQPHIVCTLERTRPVIRFFKENPTDNVALVAPSVVQTEVLEVFEGTVFQIHRDTGYDQWFYPECTRHFLGQTVSQLTLRVAQILGVKDIYMIGVDCAFDPETKKSHHDDAAKELGEATKEFTDQKVYEEIEMPGYDGRPIRTWAIWAQDSHLFAQMIEVSDANVFRVTPEKYCLPIRNTERIEVDEFSKRIEYKSAVDTSILNQSQGNAGKRILESMSDDIQELRKLKRFALNSLNLMTDYYFDSFVIFDGRGKSDHLKFLEDISDQRQETVQGFNQIYLKALHNIMQGVYAETGYTNYHLFSQDQTFFYLFMNRLNNYRRWFQSLVCWIDRILDIVEDSDN